MKIMILSDSHSMTKQTLLNFINQHPADYYIHCGDIYMPYSPLEIDNFYNVRGNNDFETFYILQFLKSVQEFIFSQARGSAQPHVADECPAQTHATSPSQRCALSSTPQQLASSSVGLKASSFLNYLYKAQR